MLWGIPSQIIIVIPNIETLHSTIEVLWTLWECQGVLNRKATSFRALGFRVLGFRGFWGLGAFRFLGFRVYIGFRNPCSASVECKCPNCTAQQDLECPCRTISSETKVWISCKFGTIDLDIVYHVVTYSLSLGFVSVYVTGFTFRCRVGSRSIWARVPEKKWLSLTLKREP